MERIIKSEVLTIQIAAPWSSIIYFSLSVELRVHPWHANLQLNFNKFDEVGDIEKKESPGASLLYRIPSGSNWWSLSIQPCKYWITFRSSKVQIWHSQLSGQAWNWGRLAQEELYTINFKVNKKRTTDKQQVNEDYDERTMNNFAVKFSKFFWDSWQSFWLKKFEIFSNTTL